MDGAGRLPVGQGDLLDALLRDLVNAFQGDRLDAFLGGQDSCAGGSHRQNGVLCVLFDQLENDGYSKISIVPIQPAALAEGHSDH